jgi:hypothetical protein
MNINASDLLPVKTALNTSYPNPFNHQQRLTMNFLLKA